MNEKDKEALIDRLTAAPKDTQFRTAEFIQTYPDAPLYNDMPRVEENPESWASVYIEADKHMDMGLYLTALAWFYSSARPTNALLNLILCKLRVLKRGAHTKNFWIALSKQMPEEGAT